MEEIKQLTVKELIDKLKALPPDAPVCLYNDHYDSPQEVFDARLEEDDFPGTPAFVLIS